MRLVPRLFAAALALVLSAANAQSNPNSATVDVLVRATVQSLCRIQTSTSPVIQLNIDPSTTGRQTASTDIGFKCSRGSNFQLFVNNGAPGSNLTGLTLKPTAGGDNLPYSLSSSLDKTTGQGFGSSGDIKLTLSASVEDYADASAGDYQDTVTVEIRP